MPSSVMPPTPAGINHIKGETLSFKSVDLSSEGFVVQVSKQEVTKVVSLSKNSKNMELYPFTFTSLTQYWVNLVCLHVDYLPVICVMRLVIRCHNSYLSIYLQSTVMRGRGLSSKFAERASYWNQYQQSFRGKSNFRHKFAELGLCGVPLHHTKQRMIFMKNVTVED